MKFYWMKAAVLTCLVVLTGQVSVQATTTVFWVSELRDGQEWDSGYVDLLTAAGHTVDTHYDDLGELDQAEIDAMNAADVVVVSRSIASGAYATDDAEIAQWNGITSPLMLMTPFLTRSNRWKWLDTTDAFTQLEPQNLEAVDSSHPIFDGVTVADVIDADKITLTAGQVTNGVTTAGNGEILAVSEDTDLVWAAFWGAGVEFYDGAGQTAGGPRLYFSFGNAEPAGSSLWGGNNSTPTGETLFVNAVEFLAAIPEPSTVTLLVVGFFGLSFAGHRRQS